MLTGFITRILSILCIFFIVIYRKKRLGGNQQKVLNNTKLRFIIYPYLMYSFTLLCVFSFTAWLLWHKQLHDSSGSGVFCCHPAVRLINTIANSPLYTILCILAISVILTLMYHIFYKHKRQYINWFIISFIIFIVNSVMYVDLTMPISLDRANAKIFQDNFESPLHHPDIIPSVGTE